MWNILSAGGHAVALRLGGRRVDLQPTDVEEQKLRNVVEEMAIAAGTPVPKIFVLDNEDGINAFAAGYAPSDTVVAVTRGTLQNLSRDELQGVVAHEFSHILHGDVLFNMRLLAVLHGIMIIGITGRMILRILSEGDRYSRRSRVGNGLLVFLAFGIALVVIGYIGVFFGTLIKAALSRQREFLADASAVQFTRNPNGIEGALKKIGGLTIGGRIHDSHAEEMSHLFFGNALHDSWFFWFSTHPPVEERIRQIDPSFDGKIPYVAPIGGSPGLNPQLANLRPSVAIPSGFDVSAIAPNMVYAGTVVHHIGKVTSENIDRARFFVQNLPEELKEASHEPAGARALIYALLLSEGSIQFNQLKLLREQEGEAFANRVESLRKQYEGVGPNSRLPLVDLSLPALRRMTKEEIAAMGKTFRAFLALDEPISLPSFMIVKALHRHLLGAQAGRPSLLQFYSIQPILPDCSVVLSALAYHGNDTDEGAGRDFSAGIGRLGVTNLPMMKKDLCSVHSFNQALDRISRAVPRLKERLVDACATAASVNGAVRTQEAELIRTVADTLDCPLPSLLTV